MDARSGCATARRFSPRCRPRSGSRISARWTSFFRFDLTVPKAIGDVIVDDADRLQVRIDDRRADEAETTLAQIAAQTIGELRARRNVARATSLAVDGLVVDEAPQIVGERPELALHGEERFGIRDGRRDLRAIANDPGIGQERAKLRRVVACDAAR